MVVEWWGLIDEREEGAVEADSIYDDE